MDNIFTSPFAGFTQHFIDFCYLQRDLSFRPFFQIDQSVTELASHGISFYRYHGKMCAFDWQHIMLISSSPIYYFPSVYQFNGVRALPPPTQECLKHQSELHILIWTSRKGYKAVLLGACSARLLVRWPCILEDILQRKSVHETGWIVCFNLSPLSYVKVPRNALFCIKAAGGLRAFSR